MAIPGIAARFLGKVALSVVNKLNLYGFSLNDLKDANYKSVIDLYDKGMLTKNLIKPIYSS